MKLWGRDGDNYFTVSLCNVIINILHGEQCSEFLLWSLQACSLHIPDAIISTHLPQHFPIKFHFHFLWIQCFQVSHHHIKKVYNYHQENLMYSSAHLHILLSCILNSRVEHQTVTAVITLRHGQINYTTVNACIKTSVRSHTLGYVIVTMSRSSQ